MRNVPAANIASIERQLDLALERVDQVKKLSALEHFSPQIDCVLLPVGRLANAKSQFVPCLSAASSAVRVLERYSTIAVGFEVAASFRLSGIRRGRARALCGAKKNQGFAK